ncbi:hypothetical protein [Kibdelosporangium phytohabitans]|uniref:Uncharacterized protein n=1 Tax=Kibdelosporangium phytohabitans TaxID=860235 RepID=A0A0N9HXL3_9PSEU|nr:hypothetical protein [Kibdelosporangium phytohabitans]ALG06827.1 hypothetical protein AOZ06_07700 [Kibdelosporangium phytohabitans]MBE1468072.1 hypothetical protein [Kibdelosporangium phytohabitans]
MSPSVGKANRDKGARAELAVVKWLRDNGWPGAERAIATGHRSRIRERADLGDITGTPGLVWQVTDRGDIEQLAVMTRRLAETDAQRAAAHADYGFLVQRRRGAADPGKWWVHLGGLNFALLTRVEPPMFEGFVRLALSDLTRLLHRAGYGTPATSEENR